MSIDPEDYIEGTELEELRETGLQGRVMEDDYDNEPKNQFEVAADSYLSSIQTLPQIETALRMAFYAGVQYGIKTAQKVYRPELSE